MPFKIKEHKTQLPDYVIGFIENPREAFVCELKPWIDIEKNKYDKVKIAKACLALKNNNGGVLLVGLTDDGQLDKLPSGYSPDKIFTQDKIQSMVSYYSAKLFEVDVHLVELCEPERACVVAIVVPGGIRTPIMCKKDSPLRMSPEVKIGTIYTRTLGSNGTVSSAPATQQDLENISISCFDNRTIDIGKFLRTHLTEDNINILARVTAELDVNKSERMNRNTSLDKFAIESFEKFNETLNDYKVNK